tara:strand:+ start:928 stop:1545 length:618 start_codon:yes stop_codon:yes gene_type:complete
MEVVETLPLDDENFSIENDIESILKEIEEKKYDINEDLYKETVETIAIFFIYLNKNKEITNIKRETFFLSEDGFLEKKIFKSILRSHSYNDNKTYIPKNILKYNFYLDPEQIPTFLKSNDADEYNFIETITSLKDIQWTPTIGFFYNLNSLHVIYHETNSDIPKKNKTKKKKKILKIIKTDEVSGKSNLQKTRKNHVSFDETLVN